MVLLEISDIVLGSPYLYDRKATFHHYENKYHLFKDGIEYIIRTRKKKTGLSLVYASEMKRIVNTSQKLTLLMIKQRYVLNQNFQKYAYVCNEFFQDVNKLSLK